MVLSTVVLIVAVLVLLVYLFYRYQTAKHDTFQKMGIDTPPTSWFFGHFPDTFKYGVFDIQTVYYNQYKDKRFYGWYDNRTPVLILKDLDMIKDICVKHFNNFCDRRILFELNDPSFKDNLTNLTGDHWKHVRNVVSPTFSSGRSKKMFKHVEKCTEMLVKKFREKQESNEEFDLRDVCYNFTLSAIARTAFGLDVNTLDDPNNQFAVEAQKVINGSPAYFIIAMLFPSLGRVLEKFGMSGLPPKSMKFLTKIIDSAIESRKETGQAGKVNDFIDLVINADTEDGQIKDRGLTKTEIHGQAIIFLFAAYDTVASVLSFTLFLLTMNPECCRKAHEEIDEKIGKGTINYDIIQELTYLDMCINESMRLYPPGVFFDRVCTESTTIQGVPIPKGMVVLVPAYAIHRDPSLWPEPEKFDPERFTQENKASRHHFAHMPFGQGPRNCIGMRLALMELKVALASILQNFDLAPCDKSVYPPKLSKIQLKANDGLWVKLEARK